MFIQLNISLSDKNNYKELNQYELSELQKRFQKILAQGLYEEFGTVKESVSVFINEIE